MRKDPGKVLLVGQPYWVKSLCGLINTHASDLVAAEFMPVPGGTLWEAIRKVQRADLVLRVGFRPGIRKWKPRMFDMLWHSLHVLHGRAVWGYYWIGTDLYMTLRDYRASCLSRSFSRVHADHHLAGAPWFLDELQEVGISGRACLFPYSLPTVQEAELRWPRDSRVLSYIPDMNPGFYGSELLYRAAQALPDIQFDIVGGTGEWVRKPLPNLRFHGWQVDLLPFLMNSTLVVRLVPHDALSGMIRKALTLARHVIYSHPVPHLHCIDWRDSEAVIQAIKDVHEEHIRGQLSLNLDGRAYALAQWDVNKLTRHLGKTLQALL